MDEPDEPQPSFLTRGRVSSFFPPFRAIRTISRSRNSTEPNSVIPSRSASIRPTFRIGGTIIKDHNQGLANDSQTFVPSSRLEAGTAMDGAATPQSPNVPSRTIRFGDEAASGSRSRRPSPEAPEGKHDETNVN